MDLLLERPVSQTSKAVEDILNTLPLSVRSRIATHILFPKPISISWAKRLVGEALLLCAKAWVRRQRPEFRHRNPVSHDDVRKLYDSESKRYLNRHARTTYRQDDAWRLWLGQAIVTKVQEVNVEQDRPARHLDLFAGSGLSYLSQANVFHMRDVSVNTILLDASPGMLDVAAKHTIPQAEKKGYTKFIDPAATSDQKLALRRDYRRTVEIAQGDPEGNGAAPFDASILSAGSLDVASIMFGLGAIPLTKAVSLSHDLLRLLAEGGRFATVDMHRPVAQLAARWGWPAHVEMRWPWLEQEGYRRITVPYVLRRLWGWYDPTLYPHLMKLAVIKTGNTWYGWEEIMFELRSGRWDFGIPVMPTYQQVMVKVQLSEQQVAGRMEASQAILSCCQ